MDLQRLFRKPPTAQLTSAPTVGQVMRTVTPVALADTLATVSYQFRQLQMPALPVVADGVLLGWVTEERVTELAATAALESLTVAEAAEPLPALVNPAMPVAELVPVFRETGVPVLVVGSMSGAVYGMILRSDALAAAAGRLAPPRIGGMATPLGVYLTTGTVSGGVGHLGLILSGMALSLMLWVAQGAVSIVSIWLYAQTGELFLLDLFRLMTGGTITGSPEYIGGVFLTMLLALSGGFLLLLRFMPLMAGYHAAEHMTVNAIEAGEALTVEVVGRMPRVHPRCGTNLWGISVMVYLAVTLLSMLMSTSFGRQHLEVAATMVLLLLLVVVMTWQRLGAWMQQHFTTRPPTEREIRSGIRAGEAVQRRHWATPPRPLRPVERIWQMGLPQVLIGVLVMSTILQALERPLDGLWRYLVK